MTTGNDFGFILLPGPHLAEVDLSTIKDSIVIFISRAIKAFDQVCPSNHKYFACGDLHTVNQILPDVRKVDKDKVYLASCTPEKEFDGHYVWSMNMENKLKDSSQLSLNMLDNDPIPWGYGSVNDMGFPLALKLGLRTIFLVGANHDTGGQFFDPNFRTRSGSDAQNIIDGIGNSFHIYKDFFDQQGIKVYNTCTYSKETAFEKVSFEELSNYTG